MATNRNKREPEKPVETPKPPRTCTCGIEIEKAKRLCAEADCPYR